MAGVPFWIPGEFQMLGVGKAAPALRPRRLLSMRNLPDFFPAVADGICGAFTILLFSRNCLLRREISPAIMGKEMKRGSLYANTAYGLLFFGKE